MAWKVSADPDERERIEKWFKSRVPVTVDEYERLSKDARSRAFTIGGTTQLRVVQTVLSELKRQAVRGDIDLDELKERLRQRLKSGYVDKNAPRLRAALNTTVQQAYADGRHAKLTDKALQDRFPYLQYVAKLDDKTTPECWRWNRTVLRADHPWWQTHWPPCHINCRSSLRALTARQARKMGITRITPRGSAADGFGLSPNNRPEWEPDADDFDQRAFEEFKKKLDRMRAADKRKRKRK